MLDEKAVSLINEIKSLKAKVREKEQELAEYLTNVSPKVKCLVAQSFVKQLKI